MIRAYYTLTKPGIIYGNAITVIAGYFLAAKGSFNITLFLATLVGISLVIASACVFNNYIDREADEKMPRTHHRPLVQGSISPQASLIFGAMLATWGFFTLAIGCNLLAFGIALVGFVVYVLFYSLLKYKTVHATLIGSIAGSTPPVVGYVAVSGQMDAAAWILFAILTAWQMPHFFAIALYRMNDYKAAGIPVHPLIRGAHATMWQMIAYIIVYGIAVYALYMSRYAGLTFAITSIALTLIWTVLAIRGFKETNTTLWARKMFIYSLIMILAFSLTLSFNMLLP